MKCVSDGWIDGQTNEWIEGGMNWWMDGWMDNRRLENCEIKSTILIITFQLCSLSTHWASVSHSIICRLTKGVSILKYIFWSHLYIKLAFL